MRQIISPHIDDAFLSLGGCISNWLDNGEDVKIIYIFTKSNWTNNESISGTTYPTDIDIITRLRKNEEATLQQSTGHQAIYLDFFENGLRGKKSKIINFLRHGTIPMTENRMFSNIQHQLLELLDSNATTYFPVAMGKWVHPDHAIARTVGLSLYNEGFSIAAYEDLPYCSHVKIEEINNHIDENIFFTPVYEEIDMDKKISLLHNYPSQISKDWLQTVQKYGMSLRANATNERYWITGV